LNVWWIRDDKLLLSVAGLQNYGIVGEYRKAETAFFTYEFYLVGTCTLMPYEAPAAATRHAVLKGKSSRDGIFCLIKSSTVGLVSVNVDNWTEKLLQKVELMWSEIVEISASSNVTLYSPREVVAVIVQVAWRYREAYLYIDNLAYGI
jgi:hypothetical protein